MGLRDYEFVRCVGRGSYGKVWLCKNRRDRKQYCIKVIKLSGIPKAERDACKHEVQIMQQTTHPNIVGFRESFFAKDGRELCIVMTYCDGGDLADRLKRNGRKRFKEVQVLHWFVQMALGVHFLHENRVLHRDLKTQNIFLLGNGRLVLGDLGISKVLDGTTDFAKTAIGTPYYMSPELFKNRPYNHKSDVWALGCVLYEMATLRHAFDAASLNGLASKIMRGYYSPLPSMYSKHLSALVKGMLALKPSTRPSLPEILQKPFIKRHIFNFIRDIAQRPTTGIGDGTMVIRAAGLGAASIGGGTVLLGGRGGARDGGLAANQMLGLKRQLVKLGMQDLVHRAFQPGDALPAEVSTSAAPYRVRHSAQPQRERQAAARPAVETDAKRNRLKQIARQQKDALTREKERKRAVENALEKLRKERELRAKERQERAERQRRRNEMMRKRSEERRMKEEAKRRDAQRKAQARVRAYNNRQRSIEAGGGRRGANDLRRRSPSYEERAAPHPTQGVGRHGGGAEPQRANRQRGEQQHRDRQRVRELEAWEDAWRDKLSNAKKVAERQRQAAVEDSRQRDVGKFRARQLEAAKREAEAQAAQRREIARLERIRKEKEERAREESARLREQQELERRKADESKARERLQQKQQKQQLSERRAKHLEEMPRTIFEERRLKHQDESAPEAQRWAVLSPKAKTKQRKPPRGHPRVRDPFRRSGDRTARPPGGDLLRRSSEDPVEGDDELTVRERNAVDILTAAAAAAAASNPQSGREAVLARKEARRREQEQAQLEALRAAGENRIEELRLAKARAKSQYTSSSAVTSQVGGTVEDSTSKTLSAAATRSLSISRAATDDVELDAEEEAITPSKLELPRPRFESGAPNSSDVDAAFPEIDLFVAEGSDVGANKRSSADDFGGLPSDLEESDLEEDENPDDDSSLSGSDAMPVADSDDDIDDAESALRVELKMATTRCEELKRTLQQTRAVLESAPHSDGAPCVVADKIEHPAAIASPRGKSPRAAVARARAVRNRRVGSGALQLAPMASSDESDLSADSEESDVDEGGVDVDVIREADPGRGFVGHNQESAVQPAHIGRLHERIRVLREQCISALGVAKFNKVFALLKEHLESRLNDSNISFGGEVEDDEHSEAQLRSKMLRLLGKNQLSYWGRVDQLLFLMETADV